MQCSALTDFPYMQCSGSAVCIGCLGGSCNGLLTVYCTMCTSLLHACLPAWLGTLYHLHSVNQSVSQSGSVSRHSAQLDSHFSTNGDYLSTRSRLSFVSFACVWARFITDYIHHQAGKDAINSDMHVNLHTWFALEWRWNGAADELRFVRTPKCGLMLSGGAWPSGEHICLPACLMSWLAGIPPIIRLHAL